MKLLVLLEEGKKKDYTPEAVKKDFYQPH